MNYILLYNIFWIFIGSHKSILRDCLNKSKQRRLSGMFLLKFFNHGFLIQEVVFNIIFVFKFSLWRFRIYWKDYFNNLLPFEEYDYTFSEKEKKKQAQNETGAVKSIIFLDKFAPKLFRVTRRNYAELKKMVFTPGWVSLKHTLCIKL